MAIRAKLQLREEFRGVELVTLPFGGKNWAPRGGGNIVRIADMQSSRLTLAAMEEPAILKRRLRTGSARWMLSLC